MTRQMQIACAAVIALIFADSPGEAPPASASEGKKAVFKGASIKVLSNPGQLLESEIAGYRVKLQKSPRLYPVWAELGGAYLRRARLRSSWEDLLHAEQALQRSLSIQENAPSWRWLAAVRLDQHRFPEAATLARRAVAAWDADGISRAIWSDSLLAMGKYDEAHAVFAKQPNDFYSIAARSRLSFLTGDAHGAIDQLARALGTLERKTSPIATRAKAWCHLMVGGYHFELDRPAEARAAYRRAQALDPDRIDVREHLAEWEAIFGNKTAAVRLYRDIIAATPRPQEKYALGALLIGLGSTVEGQSLIHDSIAYWKKRLERGDISVRRELALALLDHGGDAQFGLQLARADLEIRRDALAYDTLAWAYHRAGEREKAREAMRRAQRYGTVYRVIRQHADAIGLR